MYLKIKSQSLCNHFDRPDTSDDSSGLDRGRSQEVCKTQQRAKKRMNFGTLEDWLLENIGNIILHLYIISMAYIEYRIDNFGLQKHLPESGKKTYT
jgi:hypothetical protein